MRGRPNDPVRARAKARAHAKHAHFCSCGKVVHGNGGKAAHQAMHERKGERRPLGDPETAGKFSWVSRDQFFDRFPDRRPALGWA